MSKILIFSIFFFFCIAGWRYHVLKQRLALDPLKFCNHHEVTLHFSPLEEGSLSGIHERFLARTNQLYASKQSYRLNSKILIFSDSMIYPTQEIWAKGRLEELPDGFRFYQDKGCRHAFYISKILKAERQHVFLELSKWKIRAAMRTWLRHSLSADTAPIALGILLGEHRQISSDVLDEFRVTGTYHVLVVSGLKVALVAGMVLLLSWAFPFYFRLFFSVLAVLFYMGLAGPDPPVLRAGLMALFGTTAVLLGRGKDTLSAFLWAGAILLLWNPLWIFDAGFQLSFLSVLGIFLFVEKISKALAFLPKWMASSIAVTLSAQALLLIPMAYYFHSISFISPVANLIVVPLSAVSMVLGSVSFAFSFISKPLAYALSFWHEKLLFVMLWFVHSFSRIPLGYFWVRPPHFLMSVLFYGALFGLWLWASNKMIGKWIVAGSALVMCISWTVGFLHEPSPEIVFLKDRQGSCSLIRVHREIFLVTDGNSDVAALRSQGVNRIDGILLRNADPKYERSLASLLQHFPVRKIWLSPDSALTDNGLLMEIKRKQIPLFPIRGDEKIRLSERAWISQDNLNRLQIMRTHLFFLRQTKH